MDISELKVMYRDLLRPVFGEQFRIDDSQEDNNWVVVILMENRKIFVFHLEYERLISSN